MRKDYQTDDKIYRRIDRLAYSICGHKTEKKREKNLIPHYRKHMDTTRKSGESRLFKRIFQCHGQFSFFPFPFFPSKWWCMVLNKLLYTCKTWKFFTECKRNLILSIDIVYRRANVRIVFDMNDVISGDRLKTSVGF